MVKTTLSRYYVNKKESQFENENFNDRGFTWTERVEKFKNKKVEVSGLGHYDIKEDYQAEVSLEKFLSGIDVKSKLTSIKKALTALDVNLNDNNAKLQLIAEDVRYTEDYKNELSAKISQDTERTNEYIETLKGYVNDKDRKKEIARINKIIRELKPSLQEYLNNKWKFNVEYIRMIEERFTAENPELTIDFEIDKINIRPNSKLIEKQVNLKQVKAPM